MNLSVQTQAAAESSGMDGVCKTYSMILSPSSANCRASSKLWAGSSPAQPSTTYSACSSLSVVAMATSTRTARRAETGRSDREKRRTLEKQFGLPAPWSMRMSHCHKDRHLCLERVGAQDPAPVVGAGARPSGSLKNAPRPERCAGLSPKRSAPPDRAHHPRQPVQSPTRKRFGPKGMCRPVNKLCGSAMLSRLIGIARIVNGRVKSPDQQGRDSSAIGVRADAPVTWYVV